ncbi:MAG: magnesium transporter CorA family protein [Bacteroidales bacterium]|jgi:magnesium transporter|nr:magnesium transporter CorA family protein [Bacteroidales bacterium]
MINIYKTFGGYTEIEEAERGCWINVVSPTDTEITRLQDEFNIQPDIIRDILDADERPRYEADDDWWVIIFRIPVESEDLLYITVPLGIIRIGGMTVSICSRINDVLPVDQPTIYKSPVTDLWNFIFRLMLRCCNTYQAYLKNINHQISLIEHELQGAIHNDKLNSLLHIQKCLVYFITSLKSNEIVMARFRTHVKMNLDEKDEDLLEDAFIENKQALDVAQIYADILNGTLDMFSSVISNNLNAMMKQLTSISIILMIPTLVASFYGMNVINYFEDWRWAFPVLTIVSILMAFIGYVVIRKKDLF